MIFSIQFYREPEAPKRQGTAVWWCSVRFSSARAESGEWEKSLGNRSSAGGGGVVWTFSWMYSHRYIHVFYVAKEVDELAVRSLMKFERKQIFWVIKRSQATLNAVLMNSPNGLHEACDDYDRMAAHLY